jgi:transcriptional regulator with XRE-family HTH domain
MAEISDSARRRLGELVLVRRKELGFSLREVARRSGLMRPTWTGLEQGTRRTAEYNFAAIERTLEWGQGSVDRILRGESPTLSTVGVGLDRGTDHTAPDADPKASVRWQDVIDVLDRHVAEVGGATTLTGAQRLWGVERITSVTRRLRQVRIDGGQEPVVRWADVVAALDTTIASIGSDVTVDSEQRLWGVELAVDIAVALRAVAADSDD